MEETVEFEKLEILYTSLILFLIESISVLGRYLKCWSHGKYFFIKNKATHHQIIELLLLDTLNGFIKISFNAQRLCWLCLKHSDIYNEKQINIFFIISTCKNCHSSFLKYSKTWKKANTMSRDTLLGPLPPPCVIWWHCGDPPPPP